MRRWMAVRFPVLPVLLMVSLVLPGWAFAESELIVSAAASLTNGFQEVGKKFEAANPGVKVIFNFAASGALLRQIEMGAPVDVFASADQKTMEQAREKKLIVNESRRNFVSNRLVLVIPGASKVPVKAVRDLGRKDVGKIAIGKPETVPAGRYAQEALTNEGLWETLLPKYIYGDSVRQVLDYVSRGEVDAGIVFSTDAIVVKEKVQVVTVLEKHSPIVYPIAIVAATQKQDLAGRFLDYLASKDARESLSKYGFGNP